MEIIGRQLEVGIATEAVRGTAETVVDRWLRKVTATIMPRVTRASDNGSRGRLEDSDGSRVVQQWYDGNLEGLVHVDALGYFLMNLYGQDTPVTVSGSVVDHTFEFVESIQHPTMTIFAKDGSIVQRKFSGGVVNTFELNAAADEYVRFTANIMATGDATDANTPSYPATEFDFIGRDVSIKLATTAAGLSGATALKAKNVTISWDSQAIRDPRLGTRTPALFNGPFKLSVEVTKNYEDTTFRDLFQADTYNYVQIQIIGEANLASTYKPTFTLTLNRAQVNAWERGSGNDELVTETFTLQGFFNPTDSKQSNAVLRNLTALYT